LAVAAGLAVSASGCIIDNTGPGPASCLPDLYVNWQVVDKTDAPVTCGTAGAASVAGQVGGFTDSVACPTASATGLQLYFPLDQVGTYNVNVQLLDAGGGILSQTGVTMPPPSIYVDCSGATQTPTLFLSIN
jgi:hypothetical protein